MDDSKPTRLERPSNPEHQASEPRRAGSTSTATVGPRYASGEEIARGGMGRVIEATDTVLQRVVAIKEALTDEPELLKRFARETRITARLEHPSIVPLYDAGGGDGEPPFYVMRRVSGQPLEELIGEASTLDARLALLPNVLAATQAIAHAHKRGVIHRDLKPSNILVGELGETVVIDWGLAKVIGETDDEGGMTSLAGDSLRTRIGTIAGTPGFMSPEQARGEEHGPPSDVWALGACLYFMLARQPPHHRAGSTGDDLIEYVAARPVVPIGRLVRGIPTELAAIVDKALAFDIAQRYPDAAALAEELRRFLAGQLVAAHEYTLRERVVRLIKRNRTAVAVGLLALVVLAVVSTYAIVRVVHERDIAKTERAAALDAQKMAEREKKYAQERADSELIARARAAVTTDPVRAAAVIGMLPPTSSRVDEARGVLRSARMHGANAIGLQGDSAPPIVVEVSPRGDRAFVLRRGELLETFTLPATGAVTSTVLAEPWRAHWVDGGDHILVWGPTGTGLLDPARGATTPLDVGQLEDVRTDATGTTVVAVTHDNRIGWIDTKAGTLTSFATVTSTEVSLEVTENGQFVAITDGAQIRIFARDGRQVSKWQVPTRTALTLAASATSKFAVVSGTDIYLIDASADKPAWTPMAIEDAQGIAMLGVPFFDGDALRVRGAMAIYAVTPTHRMKIIDSPSSNFVLVGPAQTMLLDREQHLVLFDSDHRQSFSLPGALEGAVMGGRRGVPYGIVAVRGGTYVLDLRYQTPRRVDEDGSGFAMFVDEQTALAGSGEEMHWLDLATRKRFPLEVNGMESCCGPSTFIEGLSSSLILYAQSMQKPHKELYAFPAAKAPGYRFTGDDIAGISFGARTAIVELRTVRIVDLGKPPIDVITFADDIQQWRGHDDELLIASATRLVRVRISTAAVFDDRAIAPSQKGILFALGDRLLLSRDKAICSFDHPEKPLVALPQNVASVTAVNGGVVAIFDDQSGAYVSLGAEPHAYPLGQKVLSLAPHHLIVDTGVGIDLVDLPSQTRSLLPMRRHGNSFPLSLSPSEDRLLESSDLRPWLWTLPTFDGDLAAEVRATTNAKERDGVVVWPWQ
ncbi:MAG TPA: serine/threonine-protein kinase [Kofleriaceae bacterium]